MSDAKYYCKECKCEVERKDTLTPVMRGFGSILVHRTCLKIVKKIDKSTEPVQYPKEEETLKRIQAEREQEIRDDIQK